MFPDGFIYRRKQGYKGIFPAPRITKMQQSPGDQRKQDTGSQVCTFFDSHIKIPPFKAEIFCGTDKSKRSEISSLWREILQKYDVYYNVCNKTEMIIEKKNRKRQ